MYRNTPNLNEDFKAEAAALGVQEVPLLIFDAALLAQCVAEGNASNQSGKEEVLEYLEDHNHGYVDNGKYFLAPPYLPLFEALTTLYPNVNIREEANYLRLEQPAPETTTGLTGRYVVLANTHGALFDGYDENGFPCFFIAKPSWAWL